MGADTGTEITVGQRVTVRLTEAVPVTGGLMLELIELGDNALARSGARRKNRRGSGRKVTRRRRR